MNPAFLDITVKFHFSYSCALLGTSENFHASHLSILVLGEHLECYRKF